MKNNTNKQNILNIDKLEYETYDNYVDSGINYIGNVPYIWENRKFKQYVKTIKGKNVEQFENKNNNLNLIPLLNLDYLRNREKNYYYVNKNDVLNINKGEILIVWDGAACGEFIKTEKYGALSSTLAVLRTKNNNYSKFLYYLNYTFNDYLSKNFNGMGIPHVNPTLLKNLITYLPSEKEILYINKFLDQKTESIDKKISILEQQNVLSEELEKSIINQSVTKGVDSFTKQDKNGNLIDFDNTRGLSEEEFDVYMNENGYKDSGIEWIGYISKKYEVKKLKKYFNSRMGNTILKEDLMENGKYPVYSATAEDKYFGYVNNINLTLNKNDLVIPARGSIGFVKLVKEKSTATQTTIVCKSLNKINSKLIKYYLNVFRNEIFTYDDTAIPQYTVDDTNNIYILNMSKKEQLEIVKFLDNKTSQLKQQREKRTKEIELLKEYKKTLINDVVTGKIKVIKD